MKHRTFHDPIYIDDNDPLRKLLKFHEAKQREAAAKKKKRVRKPNDQAHFRACSEAEGS